MLILQNNFQLVKLARKHMDCSRDEPQRHYMKTEGKKHMIKKPLIGAESTSVKEAASEYMPDIGKFLDHNKDNSDLLVYLTYF